MSSLILAPLGTAAHADPLWKPTIGAAASTGTNSTLGSLGLFLPLYQDGQMVYYGDLRLDPEHLGDGKGSLGFGTRHIVNPDLMLGGYAYYNNERVDGPDFRGLSLGVEAITSSWDGRFNLHLPLSSDRGTGLGGLTGLQIIGNQLQGNTATTVNRSLTSADLEIGHRFRNAFGEGKSVRLFGAAYHAFNDSGTSFDLTGGRVGFDLDFTDPNRANAPRFNIGAHISYDDFNHEDVVATFGLQIPLGRKGRGGDIVAQNLTGFGNSSVNPGLLDRLNTPIRPLGIVSAEERVGGTINVIDPNTNAAFGDFYFADDDNSAGAGTFADPTTLGDAIASAGANGFVVVLENGLPANVISASETLQDGQTLVGGGSTLTVLSNGAPTAFSLPGVAGTIEATASQTGINLANANLIRNVTFTGAGNGIIGAGINGATLTDVTLNAGGIGLGLTNTTGDITARNVDIAGAMTAGLQVTGGTANFGFDAGSSITQMAGDAVFVGGGHTGTLQMDGMINATGGTGLHFNNADGTYAFNGAATLNGGDAGVDITGGSSGAFTFADTDITNPTGPAVSINSSDAMVTFAATSTITNTNAGTGVQIANNTGGSMMFLGSVTTGGAGTGVDIAGNTGGTIGFADINTGTLASRATGAGLSFTNNANVTLALGALDIFTDGATGLLANANGNSTLEIAGGNVDALNATAIDVSDTMVAAGGMRLTNVTSTGATGTGVSFGNVDGGPVNITGLTDINSAGGVGLNISGGSDSSFTFANLDLDGTGAAGVNITGANGQVGFTTLAVDDATGAGVSINGATNHVIIDGGSIGATTLGMDAALSITNTVSGTVQLTNVDINANVTAGVSLSANAGTVNLIGGTIDTNGTAGGVSVSTGTGTTTIGSAITDTGTGSAVTLTSTGGNITVSGNVSNSGDGNVINATSATAGMIAFTGSTVTDMGGDGILISFMGAGSTIGTATGTTTTITGSGSHGVSLISNAGMVAFEGDVSVTDARLDGINLQSNPGTATFGDVAIDLGTSTRSVGIDFNTSVGATTFGAVTIADVGAGNNQVGIDFNSATLSGTSQFASATISGPATSTNSIGIDLTSLSGNQIVNIGSQTDPATGPSSSITALHRGVVIGATSSVQFTFGDAEGTADTGSLIDVNGLAGSFVVDAGAGTLASASFDFDDITIGAGDASNFTVTASPTFVSETGGLITAGTHGLSQDVATIDIATALGQANTGQSFVMIAHNATGMIDMTAGGSNGFALGVGQSLLGLNDGTSISSGGVTQPMNITGNFGPGLSTGITQNDATLINSNGSATSVIRSANAGNHTISNLDVSSGATGVSVTLGSLAVTLDNIDIAISGGLTSTGVDLGFSTANVTLMDVDVTGGGRGIVSGGSGAGQVVTIDANSSITGTSQIALGVASNAGTFNYAGTISETDAAGLGIEFSSNTGTQNISGFVQVSSGSSDAIRIASGSGTTNFTGGMDIDTTTGDGFDVSNSTVNVGPSTAFNNIDAQSGRAININNTNTSTGMAFNRLTSGTATTGSGSEGVDIFGLRGTGAFSAGSVTVQNAASRGIVISSSEADFNFANAGGTAMTTVSDAALEGVLLLNNSGDIRFNLLTISDAGSEGLDLSTNSGIVTVDTATIDGSGAFGVDVFSNSGTLNINGGAIGGTTSNAGGVNLTQSSGTTSIAADITQGVGFSAVSANSLNAATNTFSGLIAGDTGTVSAVLLQGNFGGTTTNFTGGLNLDTTTADAFVAANAGTVNVTANANFNNVDSTAARALNIATATTSTGMAFNRLTSGTVSTGSTNQGILIDRLTGMGAFSAGSVTVQNAGQNGIEVTNSEVDFNVTNSAGTAITSVTGAGFNGLLFAGNSGAVTLNTVNVTNAVSRGLAVQNQSGDLTVTGEATVKNAGQTGIDTFNTLGALTFGSVDITDAGNVGIRIIDNLAAVNVNGGNIGGAISAPTFTGSNVGGVLIQQVGASFTMGDVNIAASIADNQGSAVDVQLRNSGTVTFSGFVRGDASGFTNPVHLNSNSGTSVVNFTGGMDLDSETGAAFNVFNGGEVNVAANALFNNADSTNREAVFITNSTTSTGLAFNRLTSGTATTGSAGAGIFVSNLDGTGAFSAGAVTVLNAASAGIDISGSDIDFNFTNAGGTARTTVTGSTNEGVLLAFNAGDIRFNDLTVTDAGSHGISLNTNSGAVTIDTLAIDNARGTGLITTGTTGAITISDGTIGATTTNGAGVVIGSGTGDVLIGANITQGSTGLGVEVVGRTADTVTFSGNITADTGLFNAVSLRTNTGALINFTGGLNLDTTTGTAFNATGGGTVNVAAHPSFNNVDASAGTAINISDVSTTTGLAFNRITSGTVSTSASGDGVVITNLSGAGTFSAGSVTVRDPSGHGIALTGNSAALDFGTVSIINPGAGLAGIDFAGTHFGGVTFDDVDITLNSLNTIGVDLNSASFDTGNLVITDLDIVRGAALPTGTTGVSLIGTTTTNGAQIIFGDPANAGTDSGATIGTATDALDQGVLFSATTDADFIFGDGEQTTDTLSLINATTSLAGTLPGAGMGSYNFLDVTFPTGTGLPGPAVFFATDVAQGTGDGSSFENAGLLTDLGTQTADAVVVFDRADAGLQSIDLGAATYALQDGQVLLGVTGADGLIDLTTVGVSAGGAGASFLLNAASMTNPMINPGAATNIDASLGPWVQSSGTTVNITGSGRIEDVALSTSGGTALNFTGSGTHSFVMNDVSAERTSAGGYAVNFGPTTGTFTVTGSGNAITGTNGAAGIRMTQNTAIGAAGLSFGGVTLTGTTSLDGVSMNRVAGPGIINFGNVSIADAGNTFINLDSVAAEYVFGDVTINQLGSLGISINGAGVQTTGTFGTVTINNSTFSTGAAFLINNMVTAGSTLTVAATNINGGGMAQSGISATNNDGATINIMGGSISNVRNYAIDISDSAGSFTYAGSISNAALPGGAVSIDRGESGAINTFSGNITYLGTANGIQVHNSVGTTTNFTGQSIVLQAVTAPSAVSLLNNSGGTVTNFAPAAGGVGLDIETSSFSAAFFASNGGTVTVQGTGNSITGNLGSGASVDISNTAIGAAGVAFDSIVRGGTIFGSAIDLDTVAGPGVINLGDVTILEVRGAATISLNDVAAEYVFGDVRILSRQDAGISINADGGGVGVQQTGTFGNVEIFNAGGFPGDALEIQNITAAGSTINIASVDIDANSFTGRGVSATNNDGATINIMGGSITNRFGDAIVISNSAGTFSYAGTIDHRDPIPGVADGGAVRVEMGETGAVNTFSGDITSNSSTTAIQLENNVGTTTNFTGQSISLTMSGAADGVLLQNNTGGSVTNFAPMAGGDGLDIVVNGTGTGFNASNGGTVTVQGTGNSIDATSGATALNITNTTIGAAGVTFDSIAQNGGATAITLNNSGSGAFTVRGDGTSATTRGGNGSGGTITNINGDAIVLTNAQNINLAHMSVTNSNRMGILGFVVNGLTLDGMTISNLGDDSAEGGMFISNASGVFDFSQLLMEDNFSPHILIQQLSSSAALTAFTLDDSLLQYSNPPNAGFREAVRFRVGAFGVNTGAVTIQNSTFAGTAGRAVSISTFADGSIASTTVDNNIITGNAAGGAVQGILVTHTSSFSGTNDIFITNNNIQNVTSDSIYILGTRLDPSARINATISGNIIGTAGVAGSAGLTPISFEVEGNDAATGGMVTTLITGNTIQEFTNIGIDFDATLGTRQIATLNATLSGNTIASTNASAVASVNVLADNANTVCIDIGGAGALSNTLNSPSAASGDFAIDVTGGAVVNIDGYTGAANDASAINSFVGSQNAIAVAGTHDFTGGTAQGGGDCPIP